MLKIWKNTSTLDSFDEGLNFTENKQEAIIALLGSKPIDIIEFTNILKSLDIEILSTGGTYKLLKENGIAVKSHGGTDSFGFANAIGVAADMSNYGFLDKVKDELRTLHAEDEVSGRSHGTGDA